MYQPDRVPDFVNCLVRMAEESPEGPPVWPLQGVETGCMIGYHSAVVIAEAQAKGFTGIDYAKAWPIYRKRAMEDDYRGLPYYRKLGYIPSDKDWEAVSKTLEYAYDDWAVAHLADAAGEKDVAETLRKRSRNYRNVFDTKLNFVRPRGVDGQWLEPFDPRGMGHSQQWRDFTESNAWEATFLNQHDLYAYMSLFGGQEVFERKLDELFTTNVQVAAGCAAGYRRHGRPIFARQRARPPRGLSVCVYRRALQDAGARAHADWKRMYPPEPDGLAGNEDCGQMSAWYVMSALGLYSVDPVSTNYVFGSPLLDQGGNRACRRSHAGHPHDQQWTGPPLYPVGAVERQAVDAQLDQPR